MERIALINPTSKRILKNFGDRPPLSLLYLGAILKSRRHIVKIIDMDHNDNSTLLNILDNFNPKYVGISVYTSPIYKESIQLAEMLKEKYKLIAGGYHSSSLPKTLTPYFDVVVIGEGEKAIVDIVENDLEGIVYGEKMNIETIPFPARDMINMNEYSFKQDRRPATTLLSSRGCPNFCVFCGNMNRQVRYHPIQRVVEEVKQLKKMGYNDLYFYDDNFVSNHRRTEALITELKDLKINYRITTRAQTLNEYIVKKLKESGCSWISLGIESGVDERLNDVNKHMTTQDNLNAVKLLHKHNIKIKGFFMFGLPNESVEDAEQTIKFSKKLKEEGLTSADFYIMMPFPGTPIWNTPERYGIEILDRDYTKYLEAGIETPKAYHKTKFMLPQEIEEMRNLADEEWQKN